MPAVADHHVISRNTSKATSVCSQSLRCFVFSSEKGYIAECIDLNIAVKGDTPEAAKESLRKALRGYLQVASQGETEGLIPRPAPLSHRLRFRFVSMFHRAQAVWDWSPDALGFYAC